MLLEDRIYESGANRAQLPSSTRVFFPGCVHSLALAELSGGLLITDVINVRYKLFSVLLVSVY